MTTIHLAPLKPVAPIVRERHRSFMTPIGDYYTVASLPLKYAQELIDLGVRRVITRHEVDSDVEQFLEDHGISIKWIPTEEIRLTGS